MAENQASPPAERESTSPERAGEGEPPRHPVAAFRDELDRLFDDFFTAFPFGPARARRLTADPWRRFQGVFDAAFPAVDVAETPQEYRITVELPGLEEKDVELALGEAVLTIKGEKKQESEERKESYRVSERRFGSFQRSFRLPEDVDPERIEASFKAGVLTITLPRRAEAAAKGRRIEIKAS